MSDFTDRIKELEEEIAKKKEEVHRLKYGELEDAYAEFITARDTAMEKFNAYKDIPEHLIKAFKKMGGKDQDHP